MSKSEIKTTKTEVIQTRITPQQKNKIALKKGCRPFSDFFNDAINLELSDANNLLKQITDNNNIKIENTDDYQQIKNIYDKCQILYSQFLNFENEHHNQKINVYKNIFRDFLLPQLESSITLYENNHQIDDPITD